jgi:hypothetical protein
MIQSSLLDFDQYLLRYFSNNGQGLQPFSHREITQGSQS